MTTDRINAASPDAAPVIVPGWCQRPGSDTPIHRRAESCDLVGVVTPGTRCVELRLPAGLVAELRGDVPDLERTDRMAKSLYEQIDGSPDYETRFPHVRRQWRDIARTAFRAMEGA